MLAEPAKFTDSSPASNVDIKRLQNDIPKFLNWEYNEGLVERFL